MKLSPRILTSGLVCSVVQAGIRIGQLAAIALLLTPAASAQARFKPNVEGLPAERRSGGTRDPIPACLSEPSGPKLTAIVPEQTGLTTLPYPVFQWFMPENSASHLEFRLSELTPNDDLVPVYQSFHTLTGAGSIAQLQLPEEAGVPPLEPGRTYLWSVDVYCSATGTQADMTVYAYVERIEADAELEAALAAAINPLERAAIAAENSLWYDAIALLDRSDTATAAAWQTLMTDVDLADLADFVEQP